MMLGAFKLLYHKRPIGELQYYLVVEVKDIQTLGRSNNHIFLLVPAHLIFCLFEKLFFSVEYFFSVFSLFFVGLATIG